MSHKFPQNKSLNLSEISTAILNTRPTLLWVDHNDNSFNRALQVKIENAGVTILRFMKSDEAIAAFEALPPAVKLAPQSFFRVLSNMRRRDGPTDTLNPIAGVQFAERLRSLGYSGPVMFSAYFEQNAIAAVGMAPLFRVSRCESELAEYACFQDNHWIPPNYTTAQKEGGHYLEIDSSRLIAESVRCRHITTAEVQQMGNLCNPIFIPRTLSPGDNGVQFSKFYINLGDSSANGMDLRSRIWRLSESLLYRYGDPAKLPKLKRIIVLENRFLRTRFNQALAAMEARTTEEMAWPVMGPELAPLRQLQMAIPPTEYRNARPALLFHCTRDQFEVGICASGFSLARLGTHLNKGYFGAGIYFTSVANYATNYSRDVVDKSLVSNPSFPCRMARGAAADVVITASWVLVGRPHLVRAIEMGRPLERGYTSHYAVTHKCQPIQACPAGEIADGDEIVIFSDEHILPQFIFELDQAKGALLAQSS